MDGTRLDEGDRKNLRLIGERPAALVTASSRGIGWALAERLGREGAQVFVNYRKGREDAAGSATVRS